MENDLAFCKRRIFSKVITKKVQANRPLSPVEFTLDTKMSPITANFCMQLCDVTQGRSANLR